MGKKTNYLSQIQTDTALFAFMTAVVIFFSGVLFTKYSEYGNMVKIPVSLLIISTVAFLFSALILANTSQHVIKNKVKLYKKHIWYTYVISEYLGVYLFVISIPLVVNILTQDPYLRIITITTVLVALSFYQFSGFSILESHFPTKYEILAVSMLVLGLGLFLAQIYNFYFQIVSIAFIIYMLGITVFALRKYSR